MEGAAGHGGMCPHCGTAHPRTLGECATCGRVVCDHCGSIQFTANGRKPVHRECLRKADTNFKMIRFVR